MATTIPFSYVGAGHLISIPAVINDKVQTRFIFDTGIGLNIVSKTFSQEIKSSPTGELYSGRRMSGQEVNCDLIKIPTISILDRRMDDVIAGVVDMKLPLELREIKGMLSLGFFEGVCLTIDYDLMKLVLEDTFSIEERLEEGVVVPVRVRRQEPSIDLFLGLKLPNGQKINAEVDTGSDDLILNMDLMEKLGIKKEDCEKIEGKDETGNSFTRYMTRIPGPISLSSDESYSQNDPNVIFQEIIYDGLIGVCFLKRYLVSYDVRGSRMIFRKT